jgi:hypothetical protein
MIWLIFNPDLAAAAVNGTIFDYFTAKFKHVQAVYTLNIFNGTANREQTVTAAGIQYQ